MKTERSDRIRASKVAVVATMVGMGSYVLIALIFNYSLINHMTNQVDARLGQRLVLAVKSGGQREGALPGTPPKESGDLDDDDAPVFVWKVSSSGVAVAITAGAPRLPPTTWVTGNG